MSSQVDQMIQEQVIFLTEIKEHSDDSEQLQKLKKLRSNILTISEQAEDAGADEALLETLEEAFDALDLMLNTPDCESFIMAEELEDLYELLSGAIQ